MAQSSIKELQDKLAAKNTEALKAQQRLEAMRATAEQQATAHNAAVECLLKQLTERDAADLQQLKVG